MLVEEGVGVYCAYGVVVGGFRCPPRVPFLLELSSSDPEIPDGAICGSEPIPSRDDVPAAACDLVPACSGAPPADGGPGCELPVPCDFRTLPPSGFEGACYDGCNWCLCTSTGLQCTGRACLDGGPPADAGPGCVLPPSCTFDSVPPPPSGFEDPCYDGCNWCECQSSGLACTGMSCTDGGA